VPDISWRLMLGVGALPGILLIPFKTVPPDSQNRLHIVQSPESFNSQITVTRVLRNRRYWPKIIGCAGGWFLFDITFYGNTLFAPTVLKNVFHTSGGLTPVIGDGLPNNLCLQLTILALIGLPGYYVSVYFMDSIGRKNIQMQGFVAMAVLYASLGIFVDDLQDSAGLLVALYGLTYFFGNFGPNNTTFILPSETFPREVRSSLNGLCAASGKLGAVLGASCFKPVSDSYGNSVAFHMCAACAAVGFLVTLCFVEDRRGLAMEEERAILLAL